MILMFYLICLFVGVHPFRRVIHGVGRSFPTMDAKIYDVLKYYGCNEPTLAHKHTHTTCIQSPVNNPIHFSCNCLLTLCHFPGNQSGRSSCDPFQNGIIVTRTTIYRFQQVNVDFFEMNIPMKYTAEKLKIYSSKLRTMLQNCGRSSNCKMPNGTVHITAEK